MKNIIIIGSNSAILQNFSTHQRCNAFRFLHISRQNNAVNTHCKHILHDLSRPFTSISRENLLSEIRSSIDFNLDTVLLLSAWSGTPRSSSDPSLSETIKVENYILLKNFSFLIKNLPLAQIIFLSSAGAIYANDLTCAQDENSIPRPVTPYGLQKLEAESMIASFAEEMKIPFCIFRISCAYGLNRSCPDQGVLNKWIFDGLLNGEINIYNSLDSELTFISFDQLAKSLELGIKLNIQGIFNIGTANPTSLSQIYNAVVDAIPEVKTNIIGTKKRSLNIDIAKFKSVSGLEFKANIEDDFTAIFSAIYSIVNDHID